MTTLPTPADFAMFMSEDEPLLNEATRWHLWHSAALLSDELDQQIREASQNGVKPWDLKHQVTVLGFEDYLPPAQRHLYTSATVRDFKHAVEAIIYKLGNRPPGQLLCSNTMEELAMRALIMRARFEEDVAKDCYDAEEMGYDPDQVDLSMIEEWCFQDTDHELLFDADMDGIEHDSGLAREMAFANLAREDWLKPFDNAFDRGHPLSWRDPHDVEVRPVPEKPRPTPRASQTGRKRPWQANCTEVLEDGSHFHQRSFREAQEALDYGIAWLQEHPDHNSDVRVLNKTWREVPQDEVGYEHYRLTWLEERKAVVQTTWPAMTEQQRLQEIRKVMSARHTGERVDALCEMKIVAVGPGGDPTLVGMVLPVDPDETPTA